MTLDDIVTWVITLACVAGIVCMLALSLQEMLGEESKWPDEH